MQPTTTVIAVEMAAQHVEVAVQHEADPGDVHMGHLRDGDFGGAGQSCGRPSPGAGYLMGRSGSVPSLTGVCTGVCALMCGHGCLPGNA